MQQAEVFIGKGPFPQAQPDPLIDLSLRSVSYQKADQQGLAFAGHADFLRCQQAAGRRRPLSRMDGCTGTQAQSTYQRLR